MKPEEIRYTTGIVKPYTKATRACATVAELVAELASNWSELCPDALAQAVSLTDEQWRYCVRNVKRNKSAKNIVDLAGAVIMPQTLLDIGVLATTFVLPDGCAYIRIKEHPDD
jgi:hypothetical protein